MALWTPADLGAKLFAWYDPTDTGSTTLSGSNVTAWAPKAGSGPTLVSTSGQYPTVDASSFNSLRSLSFGFGRSMWNLSTTLSGHVSVFQTLKGGASPLNSSVGRYFSCANATDLDFNSPDGTAIGPKNSTGLVEWYRNNGEVYIDGDIVIGTGTTLLLDCVQDGVNGTMYQNGELHLADTGTSAFAATRFAFGVTVHSTGADSCGDTFYGDQVITVGVLTSDEIARIQGHNAWKWGLEGSLPSGHTYKAAAPTTGSGFTLTAAAGSYILTGQAAGTLRGSKVAAAAGAYALTGVAANTLKKSRVTADAGAYALTGVAANLNKGRRMTADAGSYALTGVAANTLKGSRVTADAGAYALSGVAAGLTKQTAGAYVLSAAPGAYVLAGLDADTRKTTRMSADAGAYTLNGVAAGLNKQVAGAYTLTAEPGSYSFTGLPVTLTADIAFAWVEVAYPDDTWTDVTDPADTWIEA